MAPKHHGEMEGLTMAMERLAVVSTSDKESIGRTIRVCSDSQAPRKIVMSMVSVSDQALNF